MSENSCFNEEKLEVIVMDETNWNFFRFSNENISKQTNLEKTSSGRHSCYVDQGNGYAFVGSKFSSSEKCPTGTKIIKTKYF